MTAVPLKRGFTPVPFQYLKDEVPLNELWPSLSRSGRKEWPALLKQYRVVILADAGAGKTFELKSIAQELIDDGRPAFFLRLEDIDDDFGQSFEIGSVTAFQEWIGGFEDAWFFLDSVDEIRLSEPRAFELAIEAFASRLKGALQRAHIYISSRPYAWRPSLDQALINETLPLTTRFTEATGEAAVADENIAGGGDEENAETGDAGLNEPIVQVYLLAPLDDAEITTFARHRNVADVDKFRTELERRNLLALARSPFDLQDLISAWLANGTLGFRLEVLQGSIRRMLEQAVRSSGGGIDYAQALEGVQRLAVVGTLTGISNVKLPGKGTGSAIDPCCMLEWDVHAVEILLASGVFGDPIFGEVRFRHREVRELLVAEWISVQLARQSARDRIHPLIFRTPHGVDTTPPRLRSIMSWLVLFDETIRDRLLAAYPEIAIEGGDAGWLPPEVRQKLLTTLLGRVVDPTSDLRGLDNVEIARIAQRDLEDPVRLLIEQYRENDDALFVLGRLVWQGDLKSCVAPLSEIAANPQRGIYARLVAIRAVATVGEVEDLHELWRALNGLDHPLERRLLAEFAEYAQVDHMAVDLLLGSIDRLEPYKRFEVSGLTQALNHFIERAAQQDAGSIDGPLFTLAYGLGEFLAQAPHVERGECRVSETYQWLMSPSLHAVERLAIARAPAALEEACLAILAALPALRFWRAEDIEERKSRINQIVPAWSELNDALFWYTVAQHRQARLNRGERVIDDGQIGYMGHFWSFDAASFVRTLGWVRSRDLQDDRQVALARSFTTYVQAGRQPDMLEQLQAAVVGDDELAHVLATKLNPPSSDQSREFDRMERKYERERKQREGKRTSDRARFVEDLKADPDKVRNPHGVKPGEMSAIHYHLLHIVEGDGDRSSRAQGANWQSLIPEFGEAVAVAYRDAALAAWRRYKPKLRSEGEDTSQIPYLLIFAMAGLDIELSSEEAISALTKPNVRRALRYVPWEMNGFPRWFEAFYRRWPAFSREFLWSEILWELANTPPEGSLNYILSDIIYHAPWLQEDFAPHLFNWLSSNSAPSTATLNLMRTTILKGNGATAADIASLARRKVNTPDTAGDQLPIWYALWVDSEPAPAIMALDALFTSGSIADRRSFAKAFVVALLGGRSDYSPTHIIGNFKTPTHLKDLYLMMHREIPADDDIERANKGVFSPTLQDDAQEARERLFSLLDAIPGPLSYRAIRELSVSHPAPTYRDYMKVVALRHAVNDGDLPVWQVLDAVDFTRRLEALSSAD